MSNAPELDAAGLPEELSAVDQILHRGEANPRTRSGIMTVEILDTTPDWDRFRAPVRERVAQGAAAAAEGRDADAADRRAPLGRRPRLQPRLPRAPGARPRAGHPAPGDGSRRGRRAVAAGHLPAAVDRHARRGAGRRAGRADGASQPRRHRRCRRRRDVRQPLRPRARPAAAGDPATAHSVGPVAQRPDAARVQPAARHHRRRCARRAVRCRPGGRTTWCAIRCRRWAASSTTRCRVPG